MKRLLVEPVFTDAQRATSRIEALRYNFFARYFHDVSVLDNPDFLDNPEFGLKNKILCCPVKQLRADGYTFLFTRHPCDENALLYVSYIPPENRTAAQTDILMNYLMGILRQASQPLYILSARGEVLKFEPYLLTLVNDKKQPENDRHPLEIEALKVLKQLKTAAYRKKLKDKCCQIHRQTQQVARYISWAGLGFFILRVTFGF